MSDSSIRTATAADAERCLAVLTLAFCSDPPCRWVWPDPQQYLEAFRALLEHSEAAPSIMDPPTIMRVFPAPPCGCLLA
jgi:hypothetical protein